MFSIEFYEISHNVFLKESLDGCSCLNTRFVYYYIATFCLFRNDVTPIFRLGIFSASFVDLEQEWAQHFKFLARNQKFIVNTAEHLRWSFFAKIFNSLKP